MAFMAKLACPWQLPPKVWLEYNTLAPLTHFSQALFPCCVPGSNLECRTLSVKCTVKGLCFSVFYILGCIYEVLIVIAKTWHEVRAPRLPADPDFYTCGASSLVFFDLDIEIEVAISIWLVMQEGQLAVWHCVMSLRKMPRAWSSYGKLDVMWKLHRAHFIDWLFLSNDLQPRCCFSKMGKDFKLVYQ